MGCRRRSGGRGCCGDADRRGRGRVSRCLTPSETRRAAAAHSRPPVPEQIYGDIVSSVPRRRISASTPSQVTLSTVRPHSHGPAPLAPAPPCRLSRRRLVMPPLGLRTRRVALRSACHSSARSAPAADGPARSSTQNVGTNRATGTRCQPGQRAASQREARAPRRHRAGSSSRAA